MKNTTLLVAAVCMLLAAAVYAQDPDPAYSRPVTLPGVKAEITVFTGAPTGFDARTASDEELQTYGYPRRPDQSDAKAYGLWARAVSTTRIAADLGVNVGRYHRPNQRLSSANSSASGNWSGYSLTGGSPKFDEVVGDWIVPSVNSQFEKFTGYSSMWVGIDGNCTCDDLIQDGVSMDWLNGKTSYYAWIEFIPEAEMPIKNFTVQPGDVITAYSSVEVKSGKTYGLYYMSNFNTKTSVSLSLLMPSGTKYSGLSAEWIVERPEIGGSFQNPLPNYAFAYMDNAWAYRSGSTKKITFLSEANENIVMEDGSGKKLSEAYDQDGVSMWFEWLTY
jgi:hypothetical protein